MAQELMFEGLKVLEVYDNSDDGFEEWWKLFPKDKRHPNRKSQKAKCLLMWRGKSNLSSGFKEPLYKKRDQIIWALKEDIKAIARGGFKKYPDSHDNMEVFPGTHPWLYGMRWDRDVEPEAPRMPPKPLELESVPIPMTPAEKAEMLPVWRAMAKGKPLSQWPRRQ